MTREVTQAALEPCPWCGTVEHLSFQWPGSMTADMPDRPCRVVCTHIDHDTVVGPTAYGKFAAIAAWNTRLTAQSGEGRSGAGEDAALKLVAGYVDYTTESKDRWEQGKAAGYRELGSIVAAALNARQSGEGERLRAIDDGLLSRFRSALRFAASRSVISSADEQALLAALRATDDAGGAR